MSGLRRAGLGLAALLALAWLVLFLLGRGLFGRFDSERLAPEAPARAASALEGERRAQAVVTPGWAAGDRASQILFGDLHVHTTISFDAFMLNLPISGGEGAHPPADACDFARHCAALDFYSLNDHAENIHPDDWEASAESIRQCNARAGDPADPDLVAFLGWEWTQAGATPADHYGHRNVILAATDAERIPLRPIAASAGGTAAHPPPVLARGALALGDARFRDLALRWTALAGLPVCPEAPARALPRDCREIAATPADLFRKLDEWGQRAIVIPHGTTWGIYTPPGSSWLPQLAGAMHDPARQRLIEVYSGHGDGEAYRDWQAGELTPDGSPVCPEARPDYLPMCRRAGEIVESRCLAEGSAAAECARRAEQARADALAAGVSPQVTVPGASAADWLDAGQCRDCDQPAFMYRPAGSAQRILALGRIEPETSAPRRFRFGFVASSDIHNARAGSGYKEVDRKAMTDAGQEYSEEGIVMSFFRGPPEEPLSRSRPLEEAMRTLRGLQLYETERSQSFLYTGGLVAVHARGRDREAIWRALEQRSVYATSGPRILLWFELLEPGAARGALPMGSEVRTRAAPSFRVRAVGSLEQRPGCPASAHAALGDARVRSLCAGECYHPAEGRRPISRIEVVRIRPQLDAGEPLEGLIDDPWLRFDCEPDPAGCEVAFSDPEHPRARRDALYYVRAFEPAAPTINGATLRCEVADAGRCIASHPCRPGEQCLAPYEPRAWSSPIFVDFAQP